MKTVSRYLLKRSVTSFAGILALLIIIVTAIDATGRVGVASRHEHGASLLAQMYLLRLPEQVAMLATPALLATMLMCCAPMLRRAEFVGLSAIGISPRGATRTLLCVAAAWSVIQFILVDEVVPIASAHAYLIEDALENQVRDGKCWRVEATGTAWFAAHVRTPTASNLRFTDLAIATSAGALLRGDDLRWDGRSWHLTGHLCRTWVNGDGTYGVEFPEQVDLEGPWDLPYDPVRLHDAVLTDAEMTGAALMRRGGPQSMATISVRLVQSFGPFLGCLVLLPMFVRFANRDRLLPATTQAFAAAAMPSLALAAAGYGGVSPVAPIVPAIGLFLVAAAPGFYLYSRWRF